MSAATYFPGGFPVPETDAQVGTGLVRLIHCRISPQTGKALELISHAINYLIDECEADGSVMDAASGPTKAVGLLMAINRQIYFECPEVLTLGDGLRPSSRSYWE